MIRRKGQFYILETEHTTLILKPETAECVYYGRKIRFCGIAELLAGSERRIVSQPWRGDFTEQNVLLYNADGGFTYDFVYSKGKISAEKPEIAGLPSSYGEGKTLELKFVDGPTKVCLYQYYTVYENSDVIAVSAQLVNQSKKEIRLRRLMSIQLDLPREEAEVISFRGVWGRERHRTVQPITKGIYICDSKKGMSSHECNPFVILKNGTGLYGFNLLYSGNHAEIFESDERGRIRALTGMSDYMFEWKLAPTESFCAPEAVLCYAESEDELSERMHAFVREHIVRGKWKNRERPVLVNNWEGTYFNFDEKKILSIAAAAKEVGAELFVLDDGWFGRRNDDRSSLGDWYDNVEKTGGGLASLAGKIRDLGLAFGIWVEPEMISEDSDLYRSHPNFAMKIPGREPWRIRNQLVLNLADERVQNYVVRAIGDVLSRSGAAYVKWDFNRHFTDCFGKGIVGGEYYHRYLLGYYKVVSKLTKKFPSVLFEGCASGGGRFDLGNLCYFQQYWTSDDTDARERLAIQAGTACGYPQNTMGAHVSAQVNHQTGRRNSFAAQFNVACGGVLGYELDLSALTETERAVIKEQIAFYKDKRKLLQFGKQFRLQAPRAEGFITVSADQSEAIAVVNVTETHPNEPLPFIRFKGLNESAVYSVSVRGRTETVLAGGDVLMRGAIPLFGVFDTEPVQRECGGLFSSMYILKKVKA